jgi:aminotransferase
MVAVMTVTDVGDKLGLFSPFYENYSADAILSGVTPVFATLRPPDYTFDPAELRRVFASGIKAFVLCNPSNPTGKVFTRAELECIAELCREHDALAITDEIYEYILYDGAEHVSLAALPGMAERTVVISGLSKTWSATGWRIGWCLASAELSASIRKVHDFLTVGAPAPLQEAAAEALSFGPDYFETLRRDYHARRDLLLDTLRGLGLRVFHPRGAYYAMADVARFQRAGEDDVAFALRLVAEGGVATVPGSSFYPDAAAGRTLVRFCFAKRLETLTRAATILKERLA